MSCDATTILIAHFEIPHFQSEDWIDQRKMDGFTGLPLSAGAQPTKMRRLYKNMQQTVQNIASRLLTVLGISGPSLSSTTPVSEGRFGRVSMLLITFAAAAQRVPGGLAAPQ
jgi:hypothetical protein